MPKLPKPDAARIFSRPVRAPFISGRPAAMFGRGVAAIGQGVSDAGQALYEVGLRKRNKADAMDLLAATNEFRRTAFDLEHGEDGFRSVKGRDAVEKEVEAHGALEKARDEIAADLPDRVRERWLLEMDPSITDFQRRSAGYVRGETDRVAEQEWEDQLTGATSDAIGALSAYDERPDTALHDFGRVVAGATDIARARADEMGWSDEWVDTRIDQWKSALIADGIKALIDQDKATIAKELYAEVKDSVQPKERNQIEGQLAPAVDRDKALAKNAKEFEGIDDGYTADQMDAIFDSINAETDAGVKANRLEDATRRFAMLDKTRRERRDESYLRYYNAITDNGGDISKIATEGDFRELEPVRQNALRAHAANLVRERKPATDFGMLYRTWEFMPVTDSAGNVVGYRDRTDEEKAQFNLLELAPFVSPQDLDELRREQNAIQKALSGAGRKGHIPVIGDMRGRFNGMLVQWGGSKLDDKQKGYLRQEAIRRAEAKEAELKRNLSGTEMDEILADIFTQTRVDVGRNKVWPAGMAGALDPIKSQAMYVPLDEIPPVERARVNQYVRDRLQQPVTEDLVQSLYGQHITGQNRELSEYLDASEEAEAELSREAGNRAIEEVAGLDEEIDQTMQSKIDQAIVEAGMPGGTSDENRQLVMSWIQDETREAIEGQFKAEFFRSKDAPRYDQVIEERTRDYWRLRRFEGLSDSEARQRLGIPDTVLSLLKPEEAAKVEAGWLEQMGVEAGE